MKHLVLSVTVASALFGGFKLGVDHEKVRAEQALTDLNTISKSQIESESWIDDEARKQKDPGSFHAGFSACLEQF